MKAKQLRFKTMSEDMRNTSAWATVDTSNFEPGDKERIERLQPAIDFYLKHGRLTAAA